MRGSLDSAVLGKGPSDDILFLGFHKNRKLFDWMTVMTQSVDKSLISSRKEVDFK